jgi:type I restriction enzyme, S subunit
MADHPEKELAEISEDMRYGTSVRCSYEGSGRPVLRIPNIRNGRVDSRDLKFAIDDQAVQASAMVAPGDLLFIRTNGSRALIGRVAVVEGSNGMAFASYLIRVRPSAAALDSKFAALALSAPGKRAAIEERAATTAGQYNLNLNALRTLRIPVPPLDEQQRIVAQLEQQLSLIDAQAIAIEHALKHAATLRRAILEQAFTGKLVPQDPSDEPASVLLERIRTERPVAPKRGARALRT